MPESARDKLATLSCDIIREAGALATQLPSAVVRTRASYLVREMNSYYSNLIEGHKTLPRDIEVEGLMLDRLRGEPELSVHSMEFLRWLHGEFYRRLPEDKADGGRLTWR